MPSAERPAERTHVTQAYSTVLKDLSEARRCNHSLEPNRRRTLAAHTVAAMLPRLPPRPPPRHSVAAHAACHRPPGQERAPSQTTCFIITYLPLDNGLEWEEGRLLPIYPPPSPPPQNTDITYIPISLLRTSLPNAKILAEGDPYGEVASSE